MRIDVLTIFPEVFDNFINYSIIKRAISKELVEINIINFRDYANNKHRQVDDTPYGGGKGMVLMVQPIYDALLDLKQENTKVILLTPDGKTLKQSVANDLSKESHLILICGHYEGFDERIYSLVDYELSIGDYILTGGEIASMVVIETITRLIPGVIEEESHLNESFNNNLLDYPTYTKPYDFNGMKVPDVLISGDHEKIRLWRLEQSLKKTQKKRPDLLKEVNDEVSH